MNVRIASADILMFFPKFYFSVDYYTKSTYLVLNASNETSMLRSIYVLITSGVILITQDVLSK